MRALLFLIVPLFFLACANSKQITNFKNDEVKTISGLKLLDAHIIPYNFKFQNTLVGGLSGIDYDDANDQYFLISDERSATTPARFYTAKITINNNHIDTVLFTNVHTLKQPHGAVFPSIKEDAFKAADPESIRYNPLTQTLVWSSEGDKASRNGIFVVQQPFIYEMDRSGYFKDSFSLFPNMHLTTDSAGPRVNGVLEGLSFDKDYKYLYASLEEPLNQDGPKADVNYANAPVRITKFDVLTKKPLMQYAYLLDAVAKAPIPADAFRVNGVSEILWAGDNRLLVLERSFSTGTQQCTIKIYLADLKEADNVATTYSLNHNTNYKPVAKKLLLNMNELGRYIDNIEGISFGPELPNGHQSLLLVADNNFLPIEQTQLFLLEVLP